MPRAYSEDLQWRAVWLLIVRGMSTAEIAEVLFIAERSVCRYLAICNSTGPVDPKEQRSGAGELSTDLEQLTILHSLIHKPTLHLNEVQEKLFETTGTWVSASTICRTIKKQGFTRKKVQYIALQQSEIKRVEYMAEISAFDPSMFFWMDETGSDRCNEIRKFCYSLKGTPACTYQLRIGGKRLSAIPVMTTNGIEDVYVTTGSVNGNVIQHFICKCVLPLLLPFNGQNTRSIVIMDNASIHHVARTQEIITGVGAQLVFLPPYSPDLIPLEEVFAKVKAVLKANDSAHISTQSPEQFIKLAFSTVTTDDCFKLHQTCWLHVNFIVVHASETQYVPFVLHTHVGSECHYRIDDEGH